MGRTIIQICNYTHIHTPRKGVQHEILIQQSQVKDQDPVTTHQMPPCTFRAQVTYQKELWCSSFINQIRVKNLQHTHNDNSR